MSTVKHPAQFRAFIADDGGRYVRKPWETSAHRLLWCSAPGCLKLATHLSSFTHIRLGTPVRQHRRHCDKHAAAWAEKYEVEPRQTYPLLEPETP